MTLEYFSPDGVRPPQLRIESIATAYRTEATPPDDKPPASNHSRRAGRCNIHVDCAKEEIQRCSGALWNDASSSVQCVYEDGVISLGRWAGGYYFDQVSRAEVRLTMGGSRCSGSIVNTDFGPRFLTAQHCYVIGTPAQFYIEFNFKNSDCTSYDDNIGNPGQTVTGFRGLGRGGGDIHMCEINSAIPSSFNAYSIGYDYSRNRPDQAIGVHHPGASNMKISNSRHGADAKTEGCGGSQGGTGCWRIEQWNAATTEGGSSGSPLFNADTQRVIGALCCGTARCPAGYGWDEYGAAFSYDNAQTIFGANPTADGAEVGYYAGVNVSATKLRPLSDVAA